MALRNMQRRLAADRLHRHIRFEYRLAIVSAEAAQRLAQRSA